KLEESMMNILVPNIIFEDLGFKYVGPIDGHDIEQVSNMLKRVKENMVGPVLIHVVTQKGKGYSPAEKDSSLFHGIGPFEAKSGIPVCSGTESWSEVFGNTLIKIAAKDKTVVAITAAMAAGTGLAGFEKLFPDRFYDVGIAEQHAVTFAAGLATRGMKAFVAIYSTFVQRALDQIIHDVALQRLPVVFCIDRCGLVGEDGATHHGAFDISYLNFVPNLTILAPANAEELDQMLHWAAKYKDGPVAIRYPRGTAPCPISKIHPFHIGKADVLHKGKEIALISIGDTSLLASDVYDNLKQAGHKPWLVNLRSIKPLDTGTLESIAQNSQHIFTFETNTITGGIGSAIAQALALHPVKVINFGYPDRFVPHGKMQELNDLIGFTDPELTRRISELLS
ncbi:MAG: transketolase C-terminal domain-containing protein, partial [Candidatus Cloacimonadaceae bacterium]|nr:transketolase C-terminal domain-containing protein [Candidatus Cloacimonadaceae bacterium]